MYNKIWSNAKHFRLNYFPDIPDVFRRIFHIVHCNCIYIYYDIRDERILKFKLIVRVRVRIYVLEEHFKFIYYWNVSDDDDERMLTSSKTNAFN